MGKVIQVIGSASGGVVLPPNNATLLPGNYLTLTDAEYSTLDATQLSKIVLVKDVPDPARSTVSSTIPTGGRDEYEQIKLNALGSLLEGTQLHLYGTSFDVSPGQRCTSGQEWFQRLKTRLGLASVSTYAASSRWAHAAAWFALGTGSGTSGLPSFPASSQWLSTRRGFAIVNTYTNDVSNIYDLSVAAVPNAWNVDGRDLAQRTHALRALLSLGSAASRVEAETGTLTGTWTNTAGAQYSASTLRYTTAVGSKAAIPVTVPAAGYVDVIVLATDPATITAADITVDVDGANTFTVTGASLTVRGYKEAAGTQQFVTPARIRVTATPGAHTINLTHAGSAGQVIYLDCICIPSSTPMPIFLRQDFPIVGGLGSSPAYTTGQAATINANRATYDAAVNTIITEYPNAFLLPYGGGFDAATMCSAVDGLHPNDRGMRQICDDIRTQLMVWQASNDATALYTTV